MLLGGGTRPKLRVRVSTKYTESGNWKGVDSKDKSAEMEMQAMGLGLSSLHVVVVSGSSV